MTPEHVIFIPGILLLGIVVGYVFGSRAARSDIERKRKRARE
jgi:hypothetical protein